MAVATVAAETATTTVSASARRPPRSAAAKAPLPKPPVAANLAKLVANPRTVKKCARNAHILYADDMVETTEAADGRTKMAQVADSGGANGSARGKRKKAGRAALSLAHLCDGNPAPNNTVSKLFHSDNENALNGREQDGVDETSASVGPR